MFDSVVDFCARATHARCVVRFVLYAALVFATAPSPASAILPITGNGNTSPPPGAEDPGFAHVGQRSSGGLTLIYLGNGWVLTANHVGEADLKLSGVIYPHVPGSGVQFINDDLSNADLMAFQIVGAPELPDLPILEIASLSPAIGTPVTMIGGGSNQDGTTTWMDNGEPPTLRMGWTWGSGGAIRWGTNVVEDPNEHPASATDSFVVDFTKPGAAGVTSDEAQAVTGDSGGAVFARNAEGHWELAGVMHSRQGYLLQPPKTALDGNLSYSADLARFRDQIVPLVRPECSDEIDNDGDSQIDHPEDSGCLAREGASEINAVPSLGKPALSLMSALLVAAALWVGSRTSARAAAPRPAQPRSS